MKIGFLGLGKLGLPCALAIEQKGQHDIIGYDTNPEVIANINRRIVPYKEEGAQEALNKSNLQLVDIKNLVSQSDIIFVPIQTPHNSKYEGITRLPDERVDFDYSYLKNGMATLAAAISEQAQEKIVVIISTVLPGTIEREIRPLLNDKIKLCYNPFFIAMGTTMEDFLKPEFVLMGVDDKGAAETLKKFYKTIHQAPVFETTVASAELAKVSYNTYISMKITFINTMMEICHKTDANIDAISDSIALASKRIISPMYLRGGMGDGGGCHPRDNIALSWLARELNLSYDFFESIMIAREKQTEWLAALMAEYDLPKVILGKSFKPESNITVGSPALLLKNILEERHTKVTLYDPYVDGEPTPDFVPSVFLVATKHEYFKTMKFPQGSVVIDPWRYIPSCDGITLIPVGA